MGLVVELAGIHDDTTERTAMASDELRGRVDHHVGSVLDGADEIGGAEGIVDNDDGIMPMGYFSNAVDVGHAGIGVAEGLDDDGLGVGTEGGVHGVEIGGVYDGCLHSLCAERVLQQIVGASVEIVGCHHVVTVACHILQGIGDGGGTGSDGQSGHAPFEGSHALFEHALGGVGESSVDIAGIAQSETVGGML